MTHARARWTAATTSPTFRNTLWMLSGYILRQIAQLTAFVLLARAIGADGFGAFSAVLALAGLLSPFVEMGGFSLVVRDIQHGHAVRTAVGRALGMCSVSLPLALALFVVLKPLVFPAIPWTLVFSVALAELLANRVITIAIGVHIALEQLWRNAMIEVAMGLGRLLTVLFLLHQHGSVVLWGTLYFAQALAGAVLILIWISRRWGGIEFAWPLPLRARLVEGWHFALGTSAQSAYNETDKMLLARLASLADVGVFGAAQRIVVLANLPLTAFLAAVFPRFFEHGQRGPAEARRFALKVLPMTLAYGALVVLAFWVLAPFAPRLMGEDFRGAESAIRWLALLALLNAAHYPLADALTGSGHQHVRTRLYLLTFIVNVVLNIVLIPRLGWQGAAYATLVAQTLLVVALFLVRVDGTAK